MSDYPLTLLPSLRDESADMSLAEILCRSGDIFESTLGAATTSIESRIDRCPGRSV
jgi:hypothetical protein